MSLVKILAAAAVAAAVLALAPSSASANGGVRINVSIGHPVYAYNGYYDRSYRPPPRYIRTIPRHGCSQRYWNYRLGVWERWCP